MINVLSKKEFFLNLIKQKECTFLKRSQIKNYSKQ